MRTVTGVTALALVAVFAAACSGGAASPSAAASAAASPAASESAAASEAPSQAAAACTPDTMATKTPGTLTIGADNPAYPPYYQESDPNPDPWELGDPTNRPRLRGPHRVDHRPQPRLRRRHRAVGAPCRSPTRSRPDPRTSTST